MCVNLRITSTNSSTGCTSYIIRIIISRCGNATSIGAVAVNDAMCFSGTALRCMPGRSHSPGRGPGLTESASALRTSDAGLLPESLCRRRCGRRMQGCCLTDSCRFLWHSRHSRGKSRSPGPMSRASSATRCRCVVLRPFDISHTSFLSTT